MNHTLAARKRQRERESTLRRIVLFFVCPSFESRDLRESVKSEARRINGALSGANKPPRQRSVNYFYFQNDNLARTENK